MIKNDFFGRNIVFANIEISKIENIEKSRFRFFDPIPTSEAHISVRLLATSDSFCQNGSHMSYI